MNLKINIRTLLAFGHDVAAAVFAWYFAHLLRFNFDVPESFHRGMVQALPFVVSVQAVMFWWFGLYRGIWRYASLPDLKRIVLAVGVAALVAPLLQVMIGAPYGVSVPRSVLILDPVLLLLVMGGSRLAYRTWKEHSLAPLMGFPRKPVIILGAGSTAVNLLKELARSPEWSVVGLLDDDPLKHNRLLHDVKVYGPLDTLPQLAEKLGAEHAIIAMPSAGHGARRRAMRICSEARLKTMTVPSFEDLMGGKVTVSQIREVELDDLLGRDPVSLDNRGLRDLLTGRTILVTGAGGSIGSELCRQIARFLPRTIVLFEQSEFALYCIEQEFKERFPDTRIVCAIGDVKDRGRVAHVMKAFGPAVVFHAAAYKHVPLMESENAWQAVLNNVMGTHVLAREAVEHKVEKFVLVSTDKAVNPSNVMGASKRLAEMACQAMQRPSGTRFVMVRFGNVLGSTGSVIPKFREQIAKGGPITVTHPEVTRYFMSIPEATQLVLQAGMMGQGGEIFVLDMGQPVKIVDLARDLIRLSGLTEDDVKIVFTGLRPGEKLFEEILADGEHTLPTPHPKLRIARARPASPEWLEALLAWLRQSEAPGDEAVRTALAKWVPEYSGHPPARETSEIISFPVAPAKGR